MKLDEIINKVDWIVTRYNLTNMGVTYHIKTLITQEVFISNQFLQDQWGDRRKAVINRIHSRTGISKEALDSHGS